MPFVHSDATRAEIASRLNRGETAKAIAEQAAPSTG
jgi:hypothetical protein